jgi:hypothetical protein
MILSYEVARFKKYLPKYRWQHPKKRGAELVVTHNSDPMGGGMHYCLVSLMWIKIGSNDITAQVPGVS